MYQNNDLLTSLYPEIVVAGCGNMLYEDDGFGPAVVKELQKIPLPGNVKAVDAGVLGPSFIFPLLDPAITRHLIIVDSVDFGASPGRIAKFRMNDLSPGNTHDAQPGGITESLFRIRGRIEITIIGCQPETIRSMEIGLSWKIQNAIPKAVRAILDIIGMEFLPPREHLIADYLQNGGEATICSCGISIPHTAGAVSHQ